MTHAVVGLFEDYSDARQAVDSLKRLGFPPDQIDLSKRQSQRKSETEKMHEESTGENAVTRFFRGLFGNDDHNAKKYSGVAHDVGTIVSVYCNSEVEANQVADVMDDNGAVDVEDRSGLNRNQLSTDLPNTTPTHSDEHHTHHKTPMVTQEVTPSGERTAPGTQTMETGGSRSKSRIFQWQGEASARLREDRLTETSIW